MSNRPSEHASIFYTEWLFPIIGYYATLKVNELFFDILFPLFISIVCSVLYCVKGLVVLALKHLSTILPTVISILIGFTVMLITLLLSGHEKSIEILKNHYTPKELSGQKISLHRYLLFHFIRSLIAEIALILLVFLYLFLLPFQLPTFLYVVFLILHTFWLLSILFSIVRGVVNLFFTFYSNQSKD